MNLFSSSIRNASSIGLLLACGCLPLTHAQAAVVLSATRVIYHSNDAEASVVLRNDDKTPSHIEAWVERNNADAAPGEGATPFSVSPRVSDVEPGQKQALSILHNGAKLPKSKETVFWLNVLDTPPRPAQDEQTQAGSDALHLALRTRIKLFYRPSGLPGNANDAPAALHWTLTDENGRETLHATNLTPYYVSLSRVKLTDGSGETATSDGGMIAPGETQRFSLTGTVTPATTTTVYYQAINDDGGTQAGSGTIEQGEDTRANSALAFPLAPLTHISPRSGVATKTAVQTCEIPSFDVSMEADNVRCTLPKVGGHSTPQMFAIALNRCTADMASVRYEIAPPAAVLDQANGVVALDIDSTAKGVGMQLTEDNGAPVKFGAPYSFTGYDKNTSGDYKVLLKAAYYRIDKDATPGSAKTALTFTTTYR